MKVQCKQGDAVEAVLTREVDALLHITNCQGVMGSGIAKQIKKQIPDAYKAYKNYGECFGLELGTVSYAHVCGELGQVYNLHAQDMYGTDKRHLNYGALAECLHDLSADLLDPNSTVAVPYLMGCDRAGGDWEIVVGMLEFFLSDHTVIAYKL